VGLSRDVRPDALVLDPTIAYALGPVAEGDGSQGPVAWAWRLRVVAGAVRLARETAARDGWGPETTLFTVTGAPCIEVDLAFEQSGRAVVTMQRNTGAGGSPEVWLYYFNAFLTGFVFESFGPGRTPRVVLDNPQTPNESDVLLLYLDPVADRLRARQQRDRYLLVYDTPLTDVAQLFLEELLVTVDNRIRCVLSVRDPAAGTYTLRLLDSTLYPFLLPAEDGVRLQHPSVASAALQRALLSAGPPPFGVLTVSEDGTVEVDAVRVLHPAALGTSSLLDPIVSVALNPEDAVRPQHPAVANTSTLGTPIITIALNPEDALRPLHPVAQGTSSLIDVVIVVGQTGPNRLPAEDALRPLHPAVLATSTLS
jgi:hypothetical protein